MKLGIIGLPNVGKSTLFNALTKAGADAANYPFCTIDPNVGVVPVPDERLDELSRLYKPAKTTPAVIEFVDIAGLVRGASKGEGLGNKFLANIREVDAVVHVVRCFEDENVIHVDGTVDAARDIETINLELILSDLEILERRIDKTRKAAKGAKALESEVALLERLKTHLEAGLPARTFETDEKEAAVISTVALLSAKPIIYAANMSEKDFTEGAEKNPFYAVVAAVAEKEGAKILPISAKTEEEIASLDEEDQKMFLEELGVEESGLNRLIRASYDLLGLISFLTSGKDECRAWTIRKGTKAPQAAGVIHSDFERGFIRAEVVSYRDFLAAGENMVTAKEKGLVRSEGKEYVMQDGDIVLFRFNV